MACEEWNIPMLDQNGDYRKDFNIWLSKYTKVITTYPDTIVGIYAIRD